jgi:hypothetical protein
MNYLDRTAQSSQIRYGTRVRPLSDWATLWADALTAGMPRLPGASLLAAELMALGSVVAAPDEAV